MRLRPPVYQELARHGLDPGSDDTPETLREKLNDVYLDEVRRLRERQVGGEVALRDYARHVLALKERFPLLGLPLSRWTE